MNTMQRAFVDAVTFFGSLAFVCVASFKAGVASLAAELESRLDRNFLCSHLALETRSNISMCGPGKFVSVLHKCNSDDVLVTEASVRPIWLLNRALLI